MLLAAISKAVECVPIEIMFYDVYNYSLDDAVAHGVRRKSFRTPTGIDENSNELSLMKPQYSTHLTQSGYYSGTFSI